MNSKISRMLKSLFPIQRSITGDGNRKTLRLIKSIIPITIKEYPSGDKHYDWTIPQEWNIKDAWIKNSKGEKIVDFKKNNLHVVNYSLPIHRKMPFSKLKKHLFYRKDIPEAIPYKTSYYHPFWGFCLSFNDYKKLAQIGQYEVFIDSKHTNGSLSVGELILKGKTSKEFIISTYFCHPSQANDNLSGVVLTAFLAQEMLKMKLKFNYRFIFVPETIGAIAYLAKNEAVMKNIQAGLVITCVAGSGNYSMKETFFGNHFLDKIIKHTLSQANLPYKVYPFEPVGSDERQYSSAYFRIPCASIFKDKYGEYPYYHTSLDDLNFIDAQNLYKSLKLYKTVIKKIEKLHFYKSTNLHGETQLSKHGLYPKIGGTNHFNHKNNLKLLQWILFKGDGRQTLEDVADQNKVSLKKVLKIATQLEKARLIQSV